MHRAHFLSILASLFATAFGLSAEPPAELPLVDAVECRPRAGLPNFFAKLEQGGEARIAYLGGSITAQNGWRPKSLAHFQSLYPKAKLSEINAAIGGTGSDLGVFRLKQDVLDHRPDLMFVEFAVNDGSAAPEQIYRCMEGIVRQTWRALPECDICFVYTITEALAKAMLEGKFPRSATAMETIADHYGIPSIHLAMEVAKLAKEGRLIWNAPLPATDAEKTALKDKVVFAPDTVHPHPETGHELYLQAIGRSVDPIKAASKAKGARPLSAPFIPTNFENARLIPISDVTLSGDFTALDREKDPLGRQFATRLKTLHRASKPGTSFSFRFKGTNCAIYDLLGPDCGQVIVTVDDQPPKVAPRFDPHSTYYRASKFPVATDVPDAIHTVKVEVHPEQPDKAKILAQLKRTMDKPARFDGTAFYPGAILIVGDLVK